MTPERRCPRARHRDDLARDRILRRVDVHLDRALEEPADRFEEPADRLGVVLVLGDLPQARHADGDADHPVGVGREVVGHVVVLLEARDEQLETEGAQDVRPRQKIGMVDP